MARRSRGERVARGQHLCAAGLGRLSVHSQILTGRWRMARVTGDPQHQTTPAAAIRQEAGWGPGGGGRWSPCVGVLPPRVRALPACPLSSSWPLPLASHRLAVGVLPPHSWSSLFWQLHLWNFFPSTFEHLKFYPSFPARVAVFCGTFFVLPRPAKYAPARLSSGVRVLSYNVLDFDFERLCAVCCNLAAFRLECWCGSLGVPMVAGTGPGCHPATLQSRANLPLPVLERTQGSALLCFDTCLFHIPSGSMASR